MNKAYGIAAKWTNDCQGKKDFDGSILRISTRYWPRGGGFTLLQNGRALENNTRPEIRPSATSTIVLCYGEPQEGEPDGQYLELAEKEFEGETFEEVAGQVEAWAAEQYERVAVAIARLYGIDLSSGTKAGDK